MANHADIVEMLIDNYGVDVHSKDEVSMAHTHVHLPYSGFFEEEKIFMNFTNQLPLVTILPLKCLLKNI